MWLSRPRGAPLFVTFPPLLALYRNGCSAGSRTRVAKTWRPEPCCSSPSRRWPGERAGENGPCGGPGRCRRRQCRVLQSWGPGKFDAELFLDGKAFRPDGKTAATLIPPAFGLAGVDGHTFTGWGSVTYWNAFVANLEMHGQGRFWDPRLNDPVKFPIAARAGFGDIQSDHDLITPKLAALQFYQLAIPAPAPPPGSFNAAGAARGKLVFSEAGCVHCHVPPLYTEPGWNRHKPEEIGIDSFQADRSPDGHYRTTPLKGLWAHSKGGYYHDGRFATLRDVVDHYDGYFELRLTEQKKRDLVEFLKSL
jgi:hypothetical protein